MSEGLPIIGTEEADFLQGTSDSEDIYGLGGDDIIDGGGGGDVLNGGEGNDVYFVSEFDTVVEFADEGEDEVRTSLSAYLLADNVETLTGQSQDGQELTGNALDNIILGGSGGDVLRGGIGNDHLAGGAGSDSYYFSRGDGDDQIHVEAGPERDSLLFDFDIYSWEVTVTQSGYDIVVTVDQGGGSVTLLGSGTEFTNLSDVSFGDYTTWGNEELLARSMATTEGADSVRGDFRDNVLSGLGGGDILDGGAGNDLVDGGDGEDLLKGGSGDDVIEGGAGADVLAGGEGNDVFRFQSGFGQDVVADADSVSGIGYDRIEFLGSIALGDLTITIDGDDVLISINGTSDEVRIKDMVIDPANLVEEIAFADSTVGYLLNLLGPQSQTGTAGDDILVGTALGDSLYGLDGNDILQGGASLDELDGGAGNDLLIGGQGGDFYRFDAGDGNDVIRDEGGVGSWDTLSIGGGLQRWDTTIGRSADGLSYILYFHGGEESITLEGAASSDPAYRIETIYFQMGFLRGITLGSYALNVGNGDDALAGTAATDELRGLAGNDVIDGGEGGDRLKGDAGDDILIGGEGDDWLDGGVGDDFVTGGEGVDRIDGGAGADSMAGGSGDDYYDVDDAGDVIVEAEGEGQDEVRSSLAIYVLPDHVERLVAVAAGSQTLTGNALDNSISASLGDDVLEGGEGDDLLAGDGGFDLYRFARGDGDDVVSEYWGQGVSNAIEFAAGILPEDVSVTVSGNDLVLTVDDGGGSITWRYGLDAPDSLEVRFDGGTVWTYADIIAQMLIGGDGNDVLTGGYGDDLIYGGLSGDTLTGGGGNDIFRYDFVEESNSTERDGIQDFDSGDVIDLSRIDADTLVGGNQAFSFIGSAAFSSTAGELRFENISLGGPIWIVQGDTDGDSISDFEVVLVIPSAHTITSGDFIL